MARRSHSRERLSSYRQMRDFEKTGEPQGAEQQPPGDGELRFVVQRHRASSRHYDLRFEMDGVLASWAVPKGPTLDPEVKRMAIHVEDHPLEYADFEGVIPSGQYGAGDVIVWDRGTWTPHGTDDPVAAVRDGELHAEVRGEKLRGRLALVRSKMDTSSDQDQWLLMHKHDQHAVEGWDPEDHPRSVLSGRTNVEVKADPSARWHGGARADRAEEPMDADVPAPAPDDELAALDDLGKQGTWDVFGRTLKVTNLDKVLFPRMTRGR